MDDNKKYNSLEEVYKKTKDLVEGQMKFNKSNQSACAGSIEWKFNENVSFHIDEDYFAISSPYINTHFHSNEDYDVIYNKIIEYNNLFKLNPNYGKKSLKNLFRRILGQVVMFFFFLLLVLIVKTILGK